MRGRHALSLLLRPDRSPVLRLLQEAPLTVDDVVAAPRRAVRPDRGTATRRTVRVRDGSTQSEER